MLLYRIGFGGNKLFVFVFVFVSGWLDPGILCWCGRALDLLTYPIYIFVSLDEALFQSLHRPFRCGRHKWCLIKFTDWRYSQSCWYCRPLLWTSVPLTFSLVHLNPPPPTIPPFPVWISTGVSIQTVCKRGEGIGGLRQINTCRQVPLLVNLLRKADI